MYRHALNLLRDPVCIHDEDCRILFANNAYLSLCGKSLEEVRGEYYYRLFPIRENPLESCQRAKRSEGTTVHSECFIERNATYLNRSMNIVQEPGGEAVHIHVMEHIRIPIHIEQLLNQLPQKIFIKDIDSNYLFSNKSYADDLGLNTPYDIVGKSDFEFYDEKLAQQYRADDKRLIESGNSESMIEPYTKEGENYTVHTHKVPYHDKQGKVQGIIGIFEDITEHKRAEDGLKKAKELLEEVSEMAHVGGWSFDPETLKGEWTEELARIHDLPPDEPINVDKGLGYYAPASRPVIEAAVREVISKSTPYDLQLEIITAKGNHKWVRTLGRSVVEEGRVVKVQGMMQDITKVITAERALQDTLLKTIEAMALTVEMRDPYTAGHQKRVAQLALAIGRELNMDENHLLGLHLAASIHDLGKIRIPAELLAKPSRLTSIEFSMLQTHPEAGYQILKNISFPWPIATIVQQHHEKLDGSGYPDKLKGEQILLESRILTVADIVEAMSSHRPYRPALGIDAALEEIRRQAGKTLDKAIVDTCIRLFRKKGFSFS